MGQVTEWKRKFNNVSCIIKVKMYGNVLKIQRSFCRLALTWSCRATQPNFTTGVLHGEGIAGKCFEQTN